MNYLMLVIGAASTYFLRLYHILFYTIRINEDSSKAIYDYLVKNSKLRWCSSEEFSQTKLEIPALESSLVWCKYPMKLSVAETYMKAGHVPKEKIFHITTIRPLRSKLKQLLIEIISKSKKTDYTTVNIYFGWGYSDCTYIPRKPIEQTILSDNIRDSIETPLQEFHEGKRKHLGIILHGPPGNGKTSLIREISAKYNYNIYMPIFTNDQNNTEIIRMFSRLPNNDSKIMVVFEDFDNIFHGRNPVQKDAKYTFDALLNVFDGLYFNPNNVLFVMTANYIDLVDDAFKNRANRFDIVCHLDNPDYDTRYELLKNHIFYFGGKSIEEIVEKTKGISIASIFELRKSVEARGTSGLQLLEDGTKEGGRPRKTDKRTCLNTAG